MYWNSNQKIGRKIGWSAVALAAMLAGCTVYVEREEPEPQPAPSVQAPAPAPQAPQADISNEDLQKLVAPIALYPDPLLADLLPASTYPDQIQAADQWIKANPSPSDAEISSQPWDPTVQALCHYPSVLNYMSDEIDWTRSLGSAVSADQAGVMATIQDLRSQAMANGNLHDTPQQNVVVEGDPLICILPVAPAVFFVPVYDPVLVYSAPYVITFGPPFVVGPWFAWGCDWHAHAVFFGDWHGGWIHGPYGWHHDPYWVRPAYFHPWVRAARWGPPPRVAHFAFRREVARAQWHAFAAVHRDAVMHAQVEHREIARQQSRFDAQRQHDERLREQGRQRRDDEHRHDGDHDDSGGGGR